MRRVVSLNNLLLPFQLRLLTSVPRMELPSPTSPRSFQSWIDSSPRQASLQQSNTSSSCPSPTFASRSSVGDWDTTPTATLQFVIHSLQENKWYVLQVI